MLLIAQVHSSTASGQLNSGFGSSATRGHTADSLPEDMCRRSRSAIDFDTNDVKTKMSVHTTCLPFQDFLFFDRMDIASSAELLAPGD